MVHTFVFREDVDPFNNYQGCAGWATTSTAVSLSFTIVSCTFCIEVDSGLSDYSSPKASVYVIEVRFWSFAD